MTDVFLQPGRKPPRDVLRELRSEVGFCCPVDGCGSPYLTWHHFDPPWRKEHHHRAEGMIALCREHADKADNGSFTEDQLRQLKRVDAKRVTTVRGRFDWMRNDLLAVVGGNFFYEQAVIVQVGPVPCVWFNRDDDGYLLFNFRLPTLSGQPRAEIEDNWWSVRPDPTLAECVCPPHGRLIEVSYANGDRFRAEFFTVESARGLEEKYPNRAVSTWSSHVHFPVAVVEVWETTAGTNLELGPDQTRVGRAAMRNCFAMRCGGAAIFVNVPADQISRLFP